MITFSNKIKDLANNVEESLIDLFKRIDDISEYNQLKVLSAMQKHRLADEDFYSKTGYGYDDRGREKLESIYADVFHTEDSIVRPIIVNGTHALTLSISGLMKKGDKLLSIAGKPYDTLDEVIGITNKYDSSLELDYKQVDLIDGEFDKETIKKYLTDDVKMVYIQRSSGYSFRKSLTIDMIEDIIKFIKNINKNAIIMIDNCYGEFIEKKEPTDVGADIMAGSLIKNPGGGLAITGGYIVGRKDLIEKISYRMTSPGIGKECGLMFNQTRLILQGLFMAPTVVSGAVKGAIFTAKLYEDLGFDVKPRYNDSRSDIIQCIKLESKERVISFCKGIQSASPVDSYVTPEPWPMPGYQSDVIMAAGAFVQGSSIELSADAPIVEPYIVYFQGGLTYNHSKIGAMSSLHQLVEDKLIRLT